MRTVLLSCIVGLSGCTKTELTAPVAPAASQGAVEEAPSFLPRVVERVPLSEESDVLVITYSDYLTLTGARTVDADTRSLAAVIASRAAAAESLGLIGPYMETDLDGVSIFVVARDLRPNEESFETSEFAVVAMRVNGRTKAIRNPELALAAPRLPADCNPIMRGCHPLVSYQSGDARPHLLATPDEGGAGLPNSVIVNAEAPLLGANAAGFQPELWLFTEGASPGDEPNRFACYGNLFVEDCGGGLSGPASIAAAPNQRTLPDVFSLISEAEFARLMVEGEVLSYEEQQLHALIIGPATVANAPETRGVFALTEDTEVNGPVIVARDLRQTPSGLEATSFFIPTFGLRGSVRIAGHSTRFGLSGLRNFTLDGPCGPVSLSTSGPCEHRFCMPTKGVTLEPMNPQYGTPRWPTEPRATVRIFDLGRPMRDVSIWACAEFRPPPVQSRCGGSGAWWVGTESCNGEDDDCDGEIDESGVCDACQY
jgi:hypothetical protein